MTDILNKLRITSLSKGYDIIERFSEDIDLTYDVREIIPELAKGDPQKGAFEFDFNHEPILQSCTVMAVGRPTDTVPNDVIYSDCSGTRGTSGSPVLVRSQTGELEIKGVHVGGGQDSADYTDFTLDDARPKGRSYSNALQLNSNILGEIRQFENKR